MQCTSPWLYKDEVTGHVYEVPCGHCFECKRAKAREWSLRLALEYETCPHASFITLTYSDENVPVVDYLPVLDKRDVQLFMKRFRRSLEPLKLKYYLCGEYGSQTMRPHYHAIVYGVDPEDCAGEVEKCWQYGFSTCQNVDGGSIAYVAGYVNKKLYDNKEYKEMGLIPPFSLMSKKLGFQYFVEHHDQIMTDKSILYNGENAVPRYFLKKDRGEEGETTKWIRKQFEHADRKQREREDVAKHNIAYGTNMTSLPPTFVERERKQRNMDDIKSYNMFRKDNI